MSLISDPSTHPPATNPTSKQTPTTAAEANNEDRSVSNRKPSIRTTAAECSTPSLMSTDNNISKQHTKRAYLTSGRSTLAHQAGAKKTKLLIARSTIYQEGLELNGGNRRVLNITRHENSRPIVHRIIRIHGTPDHLSPHRLYRSACKARRAFHSDASAQDVLTIDSRRRENSPGWSALLKHGRYLHRRRTDRTLLAECSSARVRSRNGHDWDRCECARSRSAALVSICRGVG